MTTQTMALETTPEYVLAPDVAVLEAPDGTARLLDLGGRFYALPAVGARMLTGALRDGAEATINRLAGEYGVDESRIRADFTAWMARLEGQGLVRRRGGSAARGGLRAALAALLLKPALAAVYALRRSDAGRAAALLRLARLSFRLFGWTHTVAAWKGYHDGRPAPTAADVESIGAVDAAVRTAAAASFWPMECKERGLAAWSLARTAGAPAVLVVGVALFPLAGHCWCECTGGILADDVERCAAYTPVLRVQ